MTSGKAAATLVLVALLSGCVYPIRHFVPASDIVAADSSADHRALLEAAWADQVAFEAFRVQNLPRLFGPFSERPACREALGRFCLNPGDGFGTWHYIPDPPSIAAYRLDLVRALSDIARRIPADDWTAGQRVRYAVEAGEFEEAGQAALDCAGTDWWCAALAGYVFHRWGRSEEASIAFDVALASLPAADLRQWLDPTPLLDRALRDSVRALPLAGQAHFADRFWRLADPFLSRPGNEILTEHLARRVEIQFQYAAGFLDGLPWAEDMDEIILRYGLPESRIRGMGALFVHNWIEYYLGPPYTVTDLISHYRLPGLELLPPAEGVSTGEGEWDRATVWPRAGYRVAMGGAGVTWLPMLAHQVAVFRRGDAAVVVAAFDPSAHGLSGELPVDAGIALIPLDSVLPLPAATYRNGIVAPGPLIIAVEPRPALMSLELLAPGEHLVSRARYLLDIAPFTDGEVSMSDILLFEPDATQPLSLEDALQRVRGSDRVRPGDMMGLFWEMYGLEPARDSIVSMTLRIASEQAGIFTRLGRILGIVQDDNPSGVTWEEDVVAGGRMARSIVLTVPALPDGTHTIELTASINGGEQSLSSRTITVGDPVIQPLPDGEVTRRPVLRRTLCGAVADDALVVGNEANVEISREFMEASILSNLAMEAWMNPPVVGPTGVACKDWVRFNPDYFGHGAEPR